ncbi:MAG: POTRA domain-containing protein [Myxococcota bacterium]
MPRRLRTAPSALFVVMGIEICGAPALAQTNAAERAASEAAAEASAAAAQSAEARALAALVGRNLARIDVVYDPPVWAAPVSLGSVRVGQTFTPEVARRALDELADSGRFSELRAEVEPLGDGVLLRLRVVARRTLANVRLSGVSDADELLRTAGLRVGGEVSARELPELGKKLERALARRGYPQARVTVEALETDDPMGIVLTFEAARGEPARIAERRFFAWPDPNAPGLARVLASYGVALGDRADSDAIDAASHALEERLKRAGFFDARVEQEVTPANGGVRLDVKVYAGSLRELRITGNRRFDSSEIEAALELDETTDRSAAALAQRVREFYQVRGFLDVAVETRETGVQDAPLRRLSIQIHEGEPVRVVAREFPCLGGERRPDDVGSEIDSFLSELPGGTLVDAVDPAEVDALFGPKSGTGTRPKPIKLNPWSVYSVDVYERAIEHLRDLFRSEGYLSASVGPALPERRRCDPRSPPGACIPIGPRVRPPIACRYDGIGLPQEEPELISNACVADLARGVRCEPEMVLSIPIKLGPRSFIQAIQIDGNLSLSDEDLLGTAELKVGAPVSQVEIERARRRLLDRYAEEGFAFAEIEASLEFSPDHRQARVVFSVSERKRVTVSRIAVNGAHLTSESLIRRRIALEVGQLYRRSLVRKTEERLATLGVFSSVSVGLEDPYVPASEKVVIVNVQEKLPQSVDSRLGFSTGEGFRAFFEYGHNNLGGQAIGFTLHVQGGFLPTPLIFEADVRRKYEPLSLLERLERRNTVTLNFPEIGLGPLFRLSVQGIDVRHNARDYALRKDAGIVTLFFTPRRGLSFQLGGSLEGNNATIFGSGSVSEYVRTHPGLSRVFRVPESPTFVIAQRVGATWDRRDKPLDATSGTLFSFDVEHASARPLESTREKAPTYSPNVNPWLISREPDPFAAVEANFLRFSSRVAGYLRLNKRGLALAASFRWGLNRQLTSTSRTYPDRLFFMGGVDTLRGFLQDSLVPEDVAQRLLDPRSSFTIDQVAIRGGDAFVNPRLELRIPLTETVQTALFTDAGNLWTSQDLPTFADLFRLRYAVGSGIRIGTPVGPLTFDYGFNVERVLDAIDNSRKRQRTWEDPGAFHFSIGLY